MNTTEQHVTETPAGDHQAHTKTKIRSRYTPMHHEPVVIHFGAGAPQWKINCAGVGGPARQPRAAAVAMHRGGASC